MRFEGATQNVQDGPGFLEACCRELPPQTCVGSRDAEPTAFGSRRLGALFGRKTATYYLQNPKAHDSAAAVSRGRADEDGW